MEVWNGARFKKKSHSSGKWEWQHAWNEKKKSNSMLLPKPHLKYKKICIDIRHVDDFDAKDREPHEPGFKTRKRKWRKERKGENDSHHTMGRGCSKDIVQNFHPA